MYLPMTKIQTSNENWNFGNVVSLTIILKLESLKTLLMRSLVILTNVVLMYDEMFQYLEDLCNSANQHSPNDQ